MQRDLERSKRDRMGVAQADPSLVKFPARCSDSGCNRPASIAVILKEGHGKFQGWSGCVIHVTKLKLLFDNLESNLELMKSAVEKAEAAGLIPDPDVTQPEPKNLDTP